MKRSKEEISHQLERNGYVASRFSLRLEGDYSIDDAIWNYRDGVVHLSHIHPQVKNIPIVVDDDKLASLFLQSVFGIRFPIIVVDYETKEHTQSTLFSWGFFVIAVENVCESIAQNRAAVTTNYQIFSPPFLKVLHPILRWLLKRNYRQLMSQDVPVRERRGILRGWGYSFAGKEDNRSYLRTLNLTANHVIAPSLTESAASETFEVRHLAEGQRTFMGRNDHRGLQFVREGDEILVFRRMCPHQGASLDEAQLSEGRLRCTWHGRKLAPLTRIHLRDGSNAEAEGFSFNVTGGELSVSELTPQ